LSKRKETRGVVGGDKRHRLPFERKAVTVREAASYLQKYITAYRDEYERMTQTPPSGAGYPRIQISPYLDSNSIECWILSDGFAIIDSSKQPDHKWWIAGGPALCVDYEPTRTPPEIFEEQKRHGLYGKPIGIYRIVSKETLSTEVWLGNLPEPEETEFISGQVQAIVHKATISRSEFINRLTFGAFGSVIDLKLPVADPNFWVPHITRGMGFFNAERSNKRFLSYFETSTHIEHGAWDERTIFVRVNADLRRDFAHAFGSVGAGGSISFGEAQYRTSFFDRLTRLARTISEFESLLYYNENGDESVFHNFLSHNSILLDVYAEATSRPRFYYPARETPLGKTYVEPDFILKYADGSYRLVELERPSKDIATNQGHPRSAFTQASFQIAEWRHFIANYYDQIKTSFPGISNNPSALLIISRSSEKSVGLGRKVNDYKAMLRAYLPNTDIMTYDDLLERAKHAYVRLQTLCSAV
jgi:hypothetical protein